MKHYCPKTCGYCGKGIASFILTVTVYVNFILKLISIVPFKSGTQGGVERDVIPIWETEHLFLSGTFVRLLSILAFKGNL